jgi:NAD-dependent deacetylase
MPDENIEYFSELLAQSDSVTIFTGAGISTDSGIPDFRSPGGIWTKNQPIYFQDFLDSEESRRETWRRKIETDKTMASAQPNKGHLAIAKLVSTGKVGHVITQNIDGLHQASGVPENQLIELHGNATYAHCIDCGFRYELEPIKTAFTADGTLPICGECGGLVKTATVSFGQSMPEEAMGRAQEATLECDLFVSIGSSLVVYPAAGFPLLAKEADANLVILNRDPTDLDDAADLVINAEIGPTLTSVVALD